MSISDVSIRNPVFAWMLMAALVLFGWIGFSRMGVSELPDVDFPVVTVHLTLEGAAPEVLEADVVDIIEDAVTTIEGVRQITSVSQAGQAYVTLEFELSRDIDAALQEVQTKIAQAQRRLPNEMDPPVITKTNPTDRPIMWVSLSGDRPLREMMAYARDHLKDQFQTVPGVGEIFLGGFLEPNLRVWLDRESLRQKELTVEDVVQALQREHLELPAGQIETKEKELNVRALGEVARPDAFGEIFIHQRGGAPVYQPIPLKEVASIEEGLADVRRISRVLGKRAVGLGILKRRGANAVEVARQVRAQVAALQTTLPAGLELAVNFDSTRFVEETIGELKFTLLLSALLTGFVCWFFLGSFTATINILLAIPTSIIGSFLILYFSRFTLNNFTLLGLILAIGIVVDDAIMVLENIVRHQEQGEGKVQAALRGARQITFAALASTLAIVAVFLPVAFMKGVVGRFFFEFGVTMSVAVMLSLLEALTLTPMRCSQFVATQERRTRWGQKVDEGISRLRSSYRRLLESALRHRGKVLVGALLFFVLSIGLVRWLPREFVPVQDQSMLLVRLQTPVGSSLEFTDERMKQAEGAVMQRPELKRYYAAVGGFGGGEVNTGVLFLTLKPRRERDLSQQQFADLLRKELGKIPQAKVFVQELSMRGFTAHHGYPIEFTVRGPDWDELVQHAEKIKTQMEQEAFFTDVDTDYLSDMPEIQVVPDRQRAADRGVSVEAIARTLQAAIGGVRVGRYTSDGRRNDIRVKLKPEDRQESADLAKLFVRNNRGELVSLSEVTSVTTKGSLLKITRMDRERAVGLFANIAPGQSQATAMTRLEEIAKRLLPTGYRLVWSGSAQTFKESFQGLFFALWLGVIVAYMILASQFNSYLHPLLVLLALPFSVSGALLALLITGRSLNLFSLIGLILLMGIVKKNSILLVEFTNKLRPERSVNDALLEACPMRLRPILMTSFSTIAAAIPPAIGFGPGAESRIPMAVAVIGGVLVSTVLTLFVVPCAYSLMSRFEKPKEEHEHGDNPLERF